jgi:hypothetical protein
MKRETILWGLLMVATAVFFVAVGWKMASPYSLHAPGKIVPAAVGLPRGRWLLREEREEELLGAALRVLQRRIDSLAADSAGRRVYDSILEMRPGMLDSLKIAEKYFFY